ncbi:MAG: alpha/beta fold hydrolase [Chloroflexi bacterium]|nr:alpha/beta fold hydrolase [Chloroflexota bacterium]MBP7044773.1 alpha/beta fold hydrolase [Chloroflexota bacterium]
MIAEIGRFLLISGLIYVGITAVLIITNRPTRKIIDGPLDFGVLTAVSYQTLPELQPYTARDGSQLSLRLYESNTATDKVIILLHGSGWHSMQFYPLATYLSRNGLAHVITPDLRGHGFTPEQRGDVAYIGQLEDDLADLIGFAQQNFPEATMIIGGHSSGGGLAVRFAGGKHATMADAYLLLAPFLKHNAPTTRRGSGGWARPLTRRIIGLAMLNNIGIRWFNGLTVIQFNMPQAVLDGPLGDSATTAYSYRLNTAYAPRSKYGRDLAAITQPLLVVAGTDDESFNAEQYEPTISAHTSTGTYSLLPDVGHIDLLTTPEIEPVLAEWLVDLD